MTEAYPSDNSLLNLTSDSETGVEYIETGQAPYYLHFRKLLYRLLQATKRANDLRVFDEGGLNIGVKAGKYWSGTVLREYAGSSGNTLADDKGHIYVYLDESGNLVINEYSSWPAASVPHIRLADVVTNGGDITSLTDYRGSNIFFSPGNLIGLETANATGKSLADQDNTAGGIPIIFIATLTAGNTVAIHNANAPFKYRIIDAWGIAKSGDGGTWKVTNGANDITDAVSVGADKATSYCSSIDDGCNEIAASGSLSVVGDGSLADVEVYVRAIRVN